VLYLSIAKASARVCAMVYALFMILVLLTFGALWRAHALGLALLFLTLAFLLVHVVRDMTTSLSLSF
jgi:hypothetical protein